MNNNPESAEDVEFTFAQMANTIEQIITISSEQEEDFTPNYDDLTEWFFAVQQKDPPKLDHTRLSIFARAETVEKEFQSMVNGESALNGLVKAIDADLRLFELSNMSAGQFSERELTLALTYGMMNVEEGLHALVLFGEKEEGEAYSVPTATQIEEAFGYLQTVSNDRIAALIGSILAAKIGRIPVFLAGEMSLLAARFLSNIDERLVSHCIYTGIVNCNEKALLSSMSIMVLEAKEEEIITQTALSLLAHWQSAFYDEL